MRYLFGFMCVLALGVMGCGETAGTGGSGGEGGQGGDGGTGGTDLCEGVLCEDDGNECTGDGVCDPADGVCDYPPVEDGTACGDDAGTCQQGSCRVACTEQGILDAIAAGGGPYTFACNGPQTVVTQAEIVIDNNVILDGEGNLTVHGNSAALPPDDQHRVFSVSEGVTAKLDGFAVTGGQTRGDRGGGGIVNSGTLTLTNSIVSGNTAGLGGGIFNLHGMATVVNSTVSGNTADGGCGIHNFGTLTVTNSTVSGNSRASSGRCSAICGGGIFSAGMLTLTNSTVSGNCLYGIINIEGMATVVNSTVSGEDIFAIVSVRGLTLTNSLVVGACDGAKVIGTTGHNIESPGDTCGFDQTGDQVNVSEDDLKLGPLQNAGGPTMTHPLGVGSVAIDHIPAVDCEVDKDQRGQPRPETGGTMCDVGSFEVQP
jgi:hypothetical protein